MEVILTTFLRTDTYDLKKSVSQNRLLGMWRMMRGFRQVYLAAAVTLGLAAIAKTATFLLLRYLVDNVLGSTSLDVGILPVMALGFVVLAVFEGAFTFLSGKLAGETA